MDYTRLNSAYRNTFWASPRRQRESLCSALGAEDPGAGNILLSPKKLVTDSGTQVTKRKIASGTRVKCQLERETGVPLSRTKSNVY